MNTQEHTVIHLEAQEAFNFRQPVRRSFLSLTSTPMTKTFLIVIPQATRTETCDIPFSAWLPVQHIVRKDGHGDMTVHSHGAAGRFHDFPYIPEAHYALEITVDANDANTVLIAIKPLIAAIIARYTRKVAVPAER